MEHLPSISIIVPFYNVEPFFAACLESIFAQTYSGEVECLLIDDCGTDGSLAIAEQKLAGYQGPIAFSIIHHEQNRGLSAARNTGMAAARGEYLFFVDSDDQLMPDCLSVLVGPLKEGACYDVVAGECRMVGLPMIKTREMSLSLRDGVSLFDHEVLHAYAMRSWPVMAWNKLFRRSYIEAEGLCFKEGLIHEDALWSFEVACTARSFFARNRETYLYVIRSNSIITSSSGPHLAERYDLVLREMHSFAESRGLLGEEDVRVILETFRRTMVQFAMQDRALARELYLSGREHVGTRWRDCFRRNGKDLRNQFRDIHLAFPPALGFWVQSYVLYPLSKAIGHFSPR